MDFSKLSSNEKLAVYGAVAAIVGSFLSFGGSGSFGLVTGILMLILIFLPQFSPSTKLPGSKGSLMILVGGVSGIFALLALLGLLSIFGGIGLYGGTWYLGALLGAAGGILMGWASWREFQAEGGKFNLGMASGPAAPPAPPMAPPPMSEPMAPPAEMAPPMAEPMSEQMSEPMSEDEPQA